MAKQHTDITAERCLLGDYDNGADHIHRCRLNFDLDHPHRPCVCHCGVAWGP